MQLYSETPLHTAASMGFDDCVRLLIEHNACLEVVMGTMKMTALHLAAQVGEPEVIALKHESRILGQLSNPVSGSRKSQSSSPWAKHHRV